MRTLVSIATGLISLCSAVAIGDPVTDRIRATLAERFPTSAITDVRPTAMPGIYEVVNGGEIAYSDASGAYLLVGQLIDTASQKNLTRARIEEINSIKFESLPLQLAIKTVRGSGKRRLAVFADPDCPYCQELETQLAGIDDVTIYTFLFPLEQIHPDAKHKAELIWCAKDKAQAWRAWMLKKDMVQGAVCEATPIAAIAELAQKLHIESTPTAFLANGRRLTSAVSKEQLDKLLAE